jgi:hypothetical protein
MSNNHDEIISWADTALMAFIVVLIIWILRRQGTITDNISSKLETFDTKLGNLNSEIIGYKESWDTRKNGILKSFDSLCHERQGACAGLVDTKLEGIDKSFKHVCSKFDDIKRDRERRWQKQDGINEDFLRHHGERKE